MTTPVTDRADHLAETVLVLTAERGLDAVSVREVAATAGVSIGTVQHHFPTKDAMLAAAFARVVAGTRERVAAGVHGVDPSADLVAALGELVPLDDDRSREARVYVAFAARAAVSPGLARTQGDLLEQLRAEVAAALGGPGRGPDACLLLAVVDGLALQQVSTDRPLDPSEVRRVLERAVAVVVGE